MGSPNFLRSVLRSAFPQSAAGATGTTEAARQAGIGAERLPIKFWFLHFCGVLLRCRFDHPYDNCGL
jgi:hypothetical protein